VLKKVSVSMIVFELSTYVHVAARTFLGTSRAHPTVLLVSWVGAEAPPFG
jgi:hypothetical protein